MFSDPVFYLLILAGYLGGVCAGLLGLGGGVVLTPICAVIYPILGVDESILFKIIFGTNFFIILISTLISTYRYNKRKMIYWKATLPLALFSVIGVIPGIFLVDMASSDLLRKFFGVFALIAAIRMLMKFESDISKKPVFSFPVLAITGFGAAIVGALVGVGGGIVMIPVLILLLKFPAKNVPAITNSVMIFTAIASLSGYIYIGLDNPNLPENSVGFLYLSAGIPLAFGAIFGAPTGTWLNSIISTAILKKVFAGVLFIVFLRMVVF